MKAYGYKRKRKPPGDGCFLCDPSRKKSKTVTRREGKKKIDKDLSDHYQGEIDDARI